MNRRLSIFCSGQETQAQLIQLEELSNEIDQNLRTLALFQPFSETEKPLFAKVYFYLLFTMFQNSNIYCVSPYRRDFFLMNLFRKIKKPLSFFRVHF